MHRLALPILLATLGGQGCAVRSAVDPSKLTQRLEEMAQRDAERQRQLDDVNNRLFLLEDNVETSRVAMERSGKPLALPVIRLRPSPLEPEVASRGSGDGQRPAAEPNRPEPEEEASGGSSVVERSDVVYDGAAGRAGPRLVLKLHESSDGNGIESGKKKERGLSFAGPDPSQVTEKLPVVPLPKRSAATKVASDVQSMREYNEALSKYRAGEHAAAAEAFRNFFRRYSQHAYADNAVYWMAECAYDMKNHRLALKLFRQVVEDYPSGNKAPDALLKMAYCHIRLKEEKNARAVLAQVVESFPRSQVARLASETLAKMQ
jgi:tol-pal system protein YbgF